MSRVVVFDFDNTLEEWIPFEADVDEQLSQELATTYGLDTAVFKKIFENIKLSYLKSHSVPKDFSRETWLEETLAYFGIDDVDVKPIEEHYWNLILERVRTFPGTTQALERLQPHCRLVLLSDSDGDRFWKMQRVKKLGLEQYFELILTSDDIGANKPHPRCFLEVCRRLDVHPSACVMVGDSPRRDLSMAKELGFTTIWQREGLSAADRDKHYDYIDYVVDHITEVPALVLTKTA